MQVFSSNETQCLSTLIVINYNHLLTGHQDGKINLWKITDNDGIYEFSCIYTFVHHSGIVHYLAVLDNNLFVSASKDGTYGVWNSDSGDHEKVLIPAEGQVSPYCNCKLIGLPADDLLAIVGHDSGWRRGSCDIWDVATGECIYPAIEIFINPDGMEVTVAKGFLIVHSHCRGGSVYKVDRDNCIKLMTLDIDHIYSMTVSPIGEILVANRNLWVYTIGTDGTYVKEIKHVDNWNKIYRILPINPYNIVIIASKETYWESAGAIRMFKYLSDYETHKIGFRKTPSGKFSGCYCYLPLSDVLVSITDNEICLQHFPKMVELPNWIIELRMLTMLFSQAVRTGHEYLSKTPWEVLEEILALTAQPGIAYKLARKVVRDHIGWPRIRHY